MVFQPVVDLESRSVLGHEALLRGPAGSVLEAPMELLRRAADEGVSKDFDLACRRTALLHALRAGLGGSSTVFVNVEPHDHDTICLPGDEDVLDQASEGLRVVLEITEREVVTSPAALLQTVDWARERSWGIAIDDLGADPMSLAMMP